MTYNRIECGRLVLLLCALFVGLAGADPNNGSFELFDHNDFTGFFDPNGWHSENYVTVSQGFLPSEYPGSKGSWRMNPDETMAPFKGDYVLVLSTGDETVKDSTAWQEVTIQAGDKLTGVYFFGACDYQPFNDWAEIKLISINDPEAVPIMLAKADIKMLGDYGSFAGFQRFEYTFGAEQAGDYKLVLFITDERDSMLESYLVVDSLNICRYNETNPPPEYGDLNCDCTVNYEDMAKLSHDWGYDCNDQNMLNDPNCNCLIGSDIDGSGPVDFNDLRIMSENWLVGIKND
jgi:hypothetical protein